MQAKELSLVRVNVTGQPYDYFRPWQKKAPFSKRALGAVLPQGRVLVTADLVANQNYVELERAESGDKTAANVVVVDYEANLALLEPVDKKFLDGLTPLELALDTVVGDRLSAWQLESDRRARRHRRTRDHDQSDALPGRCGPIFSPIASASPMQYRDNSYTVPLVKNNKLAALASALRSPNAGARRDSGSYHRAFLEGRDGPQVSRFSLRRALAFFRRAIRTTQFAGQTGKPAASM